jgi:hypothetical protein
MPILDRPHHFVKWGNPTEVVEVFPNDKTSKTVSLSQPIPLPRDLRGGSQVIPWGDLYISVTHEVDLFNSEVGRKDAVYKHRFIVWDKEFNIVKHSRDFSIMNGHVEFAVGLCHYGNGELLMTFGFQDNAAYILRMKSQSVVDFLNM